MSYLFDITVSKTCFIPFFINQHFFASNFTNLCSRAAVSFNAGEKEQLRKFTNRSFLLDKTSRYQAWLGLVDILLAYCYEARSTEGEHNVSECLCAEETPHRQQSLDDKALYLQIL